MIQLKNVSKIFSDKTVGVKDVDLHIKPGEFVSIVGQSGTGKTTLAKLIIAEERPTKGRIIVGGWDITNIRQSEIPVLRRQIGVVFQDFKLLYRKTVFENVAFALEVAGASSAKIRSIVPQVLKIVGLEHKVGCFPRKISGGEQQRVVIARALVHRPKILLADEPTGNLDTINVQEIIDLLLKINQFGTTVVMVTHNREIVNRLKRRVIALDQGEVISDQKPDDIFFNFPSMFVSAIRAFKFAFQNFWRNFWLSLVTIFILFLTLLSISVVALLNYSTGAAISAIEKKWISTSTSSRMPHKKMSR